MIEGFPQFRHCQLRLVGLQISLSAFDQNVKAELAQEDVQAKALQQLSEACDGPEIARRELWPSATRATAPPTLPVTPVIANMIDSLPETLLTCISDVVFDRDASSMNGILEMTKMPESECR